MNEVERFCEKYNPCPPAREWLRAYTSMSAAWEDCPRVTWLYWAASRVGVDTRKAVLSLFLALRPLLLECDMGDLVQRLDGTARLFPSSEVELGLTRPVNAEDLSTLRSCAEDAVNEFFYAGMNDMYDALLGLRDIAALCKADEKTLCSGFRGIVGEVFEEDSDQSA